MRTTLELDDDLLAAARKIAQEEGATLGEVISRLARKSLAGAQRPRLRNGVPVFPRVRNGKRVDLELVNQLRDEL